jgi:RNA polymerase primary sigma factor
MSEDDIRDLQKISTMHFDSLDEYIGDGDSKSSLYELISDDSVQPTDALLLKNDFRAQVYNILDTLKPRDKKIMIALFGLDGSSPLTLKEVGEEVGLTREMVRQIKEKCLNIIKKTFVG